MKHCYWQIYIHLVWSTKNRSNILRGRLEIAVHRAIRQSIRDQGMVPICVNSAWDHTHLLVSWNPGVAIDNAVETLKSCSVEAWEKVREKNLQDAPSLRWQRGWSAFSVSPGKVGYAKKYVANQKSLHRAGATIDRYETLKDHGDKAGF